MGLTTARTSCMWFVWFVSYHRYSTYSIRYHRSLSSAPYYLQSITYIQLSTLECSCNSMQMATQSILLCHTLISLVNWNLKRVSHPCMLLEVHLRTWGASTPSSTLPPLVSADTFAVMAATSVRRASVAAVTTMTSRMTPAATPVTTSSWRPTFAVTTSAMAVSAASPSFTTHRAWTTALLMSIGRAITTLTTKTLAPLESKQQQQLIIRAGSNDQHFNWMSF